MSSTELTVISVTKDARSAMKRIQKALFPHMERPTYTDAIHEIERRLESGELSERPTADVA